MYLAQARIHHQGPFEELNLDFSDADGVPRRCVVIEGPPGTGKTTICEAIGLTRPGRAGAINPVVRRGEQRAYSVLDWVLFPEDEARPHPLRVVSPTASLSGEGEPLRRREQGHFEREAAKGRGYCFVHIPGVRYFTKPPMALLDPRRAMARYDVRAGGVSSEGNRFDLARSVKQVLAYAGIAQALADFGGEGEMEAPDEGAPDPRTLGRAMQTVVDCVTSLGDFSYGGVDPTSLEPFFYDSDGSRRFFDALPTQVRNLIALVALPARALWASSGGQDPRGCAGVVVVDDAELHLSASVATSLVAALRQALPAVQWILATSSADVAAGVEPEALKRLHRGEGQAIELSAGREAVVH